MGNLKKCFDNNNNIVEGKNNSTMVKISWGGGTAIREKIIEKR